MTLLKQSLNAGTNSHFKKGLKYKYIINWYNNEDNYKVSKEIKIDWIVDTLEDRQKIKKEMIYNSFLWIGIGNNLNREKDSKFTAWSKKENKNLL